MPTDNYYNTTNQTGQTLMEFKTTATDQMERIKNIFIAKNVALTPFMVKDIYVSEYRKDIEITSVRRAITNLTKGDILQKVGLVAERKGRPNYSWQIKPKK